MAHWVMRVLVFLALVLPAADGCSKKKSAPVSKAKSSAPAPAAAPEGATLSLAELEAGWNAEAPARELVKGHQDRLATRSILPPEKLDALDADSRKWAERIDTISIVERQVTAQEIDAISKCRYLRTLWVCRVPLQPEDVAKLCSCAELEELALTGDSLRDKSVYPIARLAKLQVLALDGNGRLDDSALPALAQLKQLKSLSLGQTAITDAGLDQLAALPKLEDLNLMGCPKLTDGAVAHLAKLTGLKRLAVGDRISEAEVHRLACALPQCQVMSLGTNFGGPSRKRPTTTSPRP